MSRPSKAKNPIKSSKTSFRIIQLIQEHNGAKLSEVSEKIDKSKSSVHNHLDTLCEMGYVTKAGSKYDIGLRFLEHGIYARQQRPLYEVAKPELEKLAEETGELVNLLVEEHGKGIYLARMRGENAVNVDVQTGTQVYLHGTALGKAILAFLSDSEVDWILDRHGMPQLTETTITDREELNEELEQVRERGMAFDDEERLAGMQCVAVPVLNRENHPVGSLSIAVPTRRMADDPLKGEIPDLLKDTSNVIQLNMTYS
jgi:DNA-binding IclR family transcriptional regulator